MSELTPCNHCTFESIKARCEKEGKTVELKRPEDEEMASLMKWAVVVDGKEVAWLMELTDHCCC